METGEFYLVQTNLDGIGALRATVINPLTEERDLDAYAAITADPEVMRYITGGRPTPRDEIERDILPWWLGYYERFAGYGFWAAIEKSSGMA
jgi:RimJ/RimL family protein N-acetyltransferase